LSQNYPNTKIVPGHGRIGDRDTLTALNNYFTELETIALKWKNEGLSEAAAIKSASAIPPEYKDYKFQSLYPTNLKTAYEQITLSKEN
jgi:cyclase